MNLKMESSEMEFQELQEKRKKEIVQARMQVIAQAREKAKKLKFYYLLIEIFFTISGYLVLGFMVSWWAVLGLFLYNWGTNMTNSRVRSEDKKNIWTEIWKL
jgi:hypothetical protein